MSNETFLLTDIRYTVLSYLSGELGGGGGDSLLVQSLAP